jgi:metal-dependent HD superfamily phosphatase/phosphodiesterase
MKDMHVDGFDSELHETRIQYKNLNMDNHSLSSKGIQRQEISIK